MKRLPVLLLLALVSGCGGNDASPQLVAQAPTGSPAAAELERLTVPAAALPAHCRLSPPVGRGFLTNPAVVTDAKLLGFMHMLVIGRMPGDAAATGRGGQAADQTFDEITAARGADVEVGYAARYQEQGGSPEIGVYALRR